MLIDCRSKDQVKHSLHISVGNLVVTLSDSQLFPQILTLAQIHQLRMLREGDVLIFELTGGALGKVNCQGVRHFQRRHVRTTDSDTHTARSVCHHNGVAAALHHIRQTLPQHFQICLVTSRTMIEPMHDVMREQNGSVDLGLASLNSGQELTATIFVMPQKRTVVLKIGTGGNTLIVDAAPVLRRHIPLNHLEILTELGQLVLILTLR